MTNETTLTAEDVKVTELERDILEAIVVSQHHDGADPVKHWTWSNTILDDAMITKKKEFPGVCSSLSKKGFAIFSDEKIKSENVCCITEAGMKALIDARDKDEDKTNWYKRLVRN